MYNRNCQGICTDDPVVEMNCLYRIFDRVNDCEIYKVARTIEDLINDCLSTEEGKLSTDAIVYRRGRELIIKNEDEVSITYIIIGEIIIDDLRVTTDLPNIDKCDLNEEIPRLSYEFLESIAQRLTTCQLHPIPSEPEPIEPPVTED